MDLESAIAAGADYLGFVLAPGSPRQVSFETAAELAAAARDRVRTVAVVVNPSEPEVRRILAAGFDVIQLHGEESAEFARAFPAARIWKAWSLRCPGDVEAAADFPAARIVADSGRGGARGGTGRVGDWSLAAALAGRRPIFLAGGLRPGNVAAAIRAVRPFGVDVSSGVERAPGRKSPARLEAFVAAVRSTFPGNAGRG